MDIALSVNVQRKSGEVIAVSLPSTATTDDLRHLLASRLSKPASEFTFTFSGKTLEGSTKLADAGVGPESTIQVEELEQSLRTLLAPDDFARGLLVQSLPFADPQVTEDKIVEHFGSLGQISRIIVQQDESQRLQHAIVIFSTVEDMHNALAAEDHTILGTQTSIRSLEQVEELAGAAPSRYAEFLGRFLARGYALGKQGAMRVSDFDKKHMISQRTMERVQTMDEQWGVTNRIMSLTESLDKRLHLSQVAAQTQQLAKNALENSMQNRYVAAGVERASGVLESAKAFGMETLGVAQKELEQVQVTHDATDPALLPDAATMEASDETYLQEEEEETKQST